MMKGKLNLLPTFYIRFAKEHNMSNCNNKINSKCGEFVLVTKTPMQLEAKRQVRWLKGYDKQYIRQ